MSCPAIVNHSALLCDTCTAAGSIATGGGGAMPGCVTLKETLDAQDAVVWNRRNADRCCHNRMGHGHDPLAKPAGNRRHGDQRFCHDDERDGPPGSALRCVLIGARSFGEPGPVKLKPRTNFAEASFRHSLE